MAGYYFDVELMITDMGGPTEVSRTTGYVRQTVSRWITQGHISTEILAYLLSFYEFNVHDYILPLPEGQAPRRREATRKICEQRKAEAAKKGKKYVPANERTRRRKHRNSKRKAGSSPLLPSGV